MKHFDRETFVKDFKLKKPTFGLDDKARAEYKLKELINNHKSPSYANRAKH